MKSNALAGSGVVLTMLAMTAAGCAGHGQDQEAVNTATAGAAMQKSGVMSQSDYTKIRGLEHQVSRTHAISGDDLAWTLGLLRTAGNPLARARAFTALSEVRPLSAAQRAEILPAIAPYLRSADRLDQLGAQRAMEAAGAGR